MNRLSNTLIFLSGCAVGVITTQQYFKNKYEQQYQEDKESVVQAFSAEQATEEQLVAAEAAKNKPELQEYAAKLKENGYTNYSSIGDSKPVVKPEEDDEYIVDKPYVISPEDFGEFDYYNQISLTYYSDGVLTEGDDVIEDVDDIVGEESLSHFGEYEEDSVHVRNDRLKCDYEILWDNRNHSDVVKSKPRPVEVED